jgi:Domain of unknown function (DUF4386)
MSSIKTTARLAGVLYLLLLAMAGFNLFYVSTVCIVTGDPGATARKIIAAEETYRLGILSDIVGSILLIYLAMSLFELLKDTDKKQAAMMLILACVTAAFSLANLLNQIASLVLLNGADYLAAFPKAQLEALALASLKLRTDGIEAIGVLHALWLFLFGALVIRSGFLPKALGLLLIAASLATLTNSLTSILQPAYRRAVFQVTAPLDGIAELSTAIWLLVARLSPTKQPAD